MGSYGSDEQVSSQPSAMRGEASPGNAYCYYLSLGWWDVDVPPNHYYCEQNKDNNADAESHS